jgi:hypothetical protein
MKLRLRNAHRFFDPLTTTTRTLSAGTACTPLTTDEYARHCEARDAGNLARGVSTGPYSEIDFTDRLVAAGQFIAFTVAQDPWVHVLEADAFSVADEG